MPGPNIPPRTIGTRLATWRRRNFHTQQELANVLHLHREAVTEIERGRRKLSFVEANILRVRLALDWTDLTES